MGWQAPSSQVRKPYSNPNVPEDFSVWHAKRHEDTPSSFCMKKTGMGAFQRPASIVEYSESICEILPTDHQGANIGIYLHKQVWKLTYMLRSPPHIQRLSISDLVSEKEKKNHPSSISSVTSNDLLISYNVLSQNPVEAL